MVLSTLATDGEALLPPPPAAAGFDKDDEDEDCFIVPTGLVVLPLLLRDVSKGLADDNGLLDGASGGRVVVVADDEEGVDVYIYVKGQRNGKIH